MAEGDTLTYGATGAGIGTAIAPGIGTAIGGGVGALVGWGKGLFDGSGDPKVPIQYQDRDRMLGLINGGYGAQNAGGITGYGAPQLQMGADPFRAAQLQQLQQLRGIASGQQQGAGELAAQRQIQNALSAQQAQARMARGGNAALAYRNAANQSAALGSTGAGMGQQAALQDQMNAQGLLGQVGATGRTGDINVANANAGYQQGANQLNSSNYIALLNQLNQMNSAQLGAQAQQAAAATQADRQLTGGLINTAGQIGGAYLAGRGKSGGGAAPPTTPVGGDGYY